MYQFNFLKLIAIAWREFTNPTYLNWSLEWCPLSFLGTRKKVVRKWSFAGCTNFIACFSIFFSISWSARACSSCFIWISESKKHWMGFDDSGTWYPWIIFKMWRLFVSFFQFSRKNFRRPGVARFSRFPNCQQFFYCWMKFRKNISWSDISNFRSNLTGGTLTCFKCCSLEILEMLESGNSESGNIIFKTTNLLALYPLPLIGCLEVEGLFRRTVDW